MTRKKQVLTENLFSVISVMEMGGIGRSLKFFFAGRLKG